MLPQVGEKVTSSLRAAEEREGRSGAELKQASAELARQRAHAALAINQSGDELTTTRTDLETSRARIASLESEIDSLQRSLEVAGAAAADEMAARLDSVSDEAEKAEQRLQALLVDERTACHAAKEEAARGREAVVRLEAERDAAETKAAEGMLLQRQAEAAEAVVGELRAEKAAMSERLAAAERAAGAAASLAAPIEAAASGGASGDGALAAATARVAEQVETIARLERAVREASAAPLPSASSDGRALLSVLQAPNASSGGGGAAAAQPASASAAQQAAAAEASRAAAAREAMLVEKGQEVDFLRHEMGELQAALKRSEKGIDLTFLKNVLVRYLKEGDLDSALPVLAQALELSAQEVSEIRQQQRGVRGEVGRVLGLW